MLIQWLIVILPWTVTVTAETCPEGTIPYPPGKEDAPDSCYVILTKHVTWHWWIEFNKFSSNGKTPTEFQELSMDTSVWDVQNARNMCQNFYRMGDIVNVPDTEMNQWKQLDDYFKKHQDKYFRLPIIETSHEDNWLYNISAHDRENLGTSYWIDLEYEPDSGEAFWATTGQFLTTADHNPQPQEEDPEWEEDFVYTEDKDDMVRMCFVSVANYGDMELKGWHKRACAQAFARMVPFEACKSYATGLVLFGGSGKVAVFYEYYRKRHAPISVFCEMPMEPEPKATTPSGRGTMGPKSRKTRKTKKPRRQTAEMKSGPNGLAVIVATTTVCRVLSRP